MITANTDIRALLQRLQARGTNITERRSDSIVRAARRTPLDWHSARSLWPDLGWD